MNLITTKDVTINRFIVVLLVAMIFMAGITEGFSIATLVNQDKEIREIKSMQKDLATVQEVNYTYNFYLSEELTVSEQMDVLKDVLPNLQSKREEKSEKDSILDKYNTLGELYSESEEQEENEHEQEKEPIVEKTIEEIRGCVNETTLEKELEAKYQEQIEEEKKVDEKKVDLLANLMYAEEGVLYTKYFETEPEKVEKVFKLAGSVPIHRVEINLYGAECLEDVIFSTAYDSHTIARIKKGQNNIPEDVYKWAEELCLEGPEGPRGMIYQAEFHQGDEVYYEAFNQKFCIETRYN